MMGNYYVSTAYRSREDRENTQNAAFPLILFTLQLCQCFDEPSALKNQMQAFFAGDIAKAKFEVYFGLMYSLYSIPNTVLPFIGGVLVDRCGVRLMLVIFYSLIMIGQVLMSTGCSMHSLELMLLGRIVFGLGGECIWIGQTAIIVLWFKDKELAFALGIATACGRLGGVLNNQMSPLLAAQGGGVELALWSGVGISAIGFLSTLVLVCVDRAFECKPSGSSGSSFTERTPPRLKTPLRSLEKSNTKPHSYGTVPTEEPTDALEMRTSAAASGGGSLSDIFKFKARFWMVGVLCVVTYATVIPFNNNAQDFLTRAYYANTVPEPSGPSSLAANQTDSIHGLEQLQSVTAAAECSRAPIPDEWVEFCTSQSRSIHTASLVMSIPYTMSAVLAPVLGYVVDTYGGGAFLSMSCPVLLSFVHLSLAFQWTGPVAALLGMGMAYSTFAAVIWPLIPRTVDESQTATAFGATTSLQNIGMSLTPIAISMLTNKEGTLDYFKVELLFASLAAAGVVVGVCLNIVDTASGGVLNKPQRH
jgi:MFS family permease